MCTLFICLQSRTCLTVVFMCVQVLPSQRMNETPLLPWVIMTSTGEVIAAHCDCMAGLAQTSTHVAALLFKVKAVVRIRQKTTVTAVAAYWMVLIR